MGFYRQEDCEGWNWGKCSKFEPSNPSKEADVLGFTYINKPEELDDAMREGVQNNDK